MAFRTKSFYTQPPPPLPDRDYYFLTSPHMAEQQKVNAIIALEQSAVATDLVRDLSEVRRVLFFRSPTTGGKRAAALAR